MIRLKAPARDGKANQALRRFLADEFQTRLSNVTIERGAKHRDKVVRILSPGRVPGAVTEMPGQGAAGRLDGPPGLN